jgi:hypothetical protein
MDFERLKDHLATQAGLRRDKLKRQFPHVSQKIDRLQFHLKNIRRHSAKTLASAVLVGGLLAVAPLASSPLSTTPHVRPLSQEQEAAIVRDTLSKLLPSTIGPLHPDLERSIHDLFKNTLNINAVAELDGHHLNTTYGRIGGEQHLPRYLGDTISQHDDLQIKGITASRGAFGYFANSKSEMTEEAIQREKYYVAVQTLYLPDWNHNYKTLKEWYKWRKVLVVNPTTGKSIIAVVGDAGPAAWTGKHFGGSPEVMDYLQPYKDKNNGKVVVFFVDDPQNTIALGPVIEEASQFIAKK